MNAGMKERKKRGNEGKLADSNNPALQGVHWCYITTHLQLLTSRHSIFFNDQSLIYKPYRHATIEPYMFS